MLISYPFLKSDVKDDDKDTVTEAFGGGYPVNGYLEWHNGKHIIAPVDGNRFADARAIADGILIYTDKPDSEPSKVKSHAQNYAAHGGDKEWTDKGMVIIEHKTEIGANGTTPVEITYYSVYAHLKSLHADLPAVGKPIYRKTAIGQAGQIYGEDHHMHFEICMDEKNLKILLNADPANWPKAEAVPTKDGRTDAVFGSTYVYLPASTPVQATAPTSHMRGTGAQLLNTPQWVQIDYAGKATLTSYTKEGTEIGHRADADAEYDLYKEAHDRHNSLAAPDKASSSPSGWYELLRFGRNLGRGPAATDKDPLPANAAHWRKIKTPAGDVWADLNTEGSFKLSDADFPAFLGWDCFGDDKTPLDQRCDSDKLKKLLVSEYDDPEQKAKVLNDHERLFVQTSKERIKAKLRKAICKFSSEFDQSNFKERYGYIEEEEDFVGQTQAWEKLCAHIKSLSKADLPQGYKDALWHFHPVEFIDVMRKCGWLSKAEFTQLLPSHAVRTGQYTDAHGVRHSGVFWEGNDGPENPSQRGIAVASVVTNHRIPLNRSLRKYGFTAPMRQVSFFGNAVQESGWLGTLAEGSGASTWYAPWFGRGFLQLTGPGNYVAYWRWRGRPFDAGLESSLNAAYNDMYAHSARRSLHLLADANFAGITNEIQDWRNKVNGGPDRVPIGDALVAPSDSAGFYAIWNKLLKYADETHTLERHAVATVRANGVSSGEHVYYCSQAFWKVSASVNLPGAVSRTNYSGINGFDSRCSAYGVALAVLTEMRFPNAQGDNVLEFPEGYTPRRG